MLKSILVEVEVVISNTPIQCQHMTSGAISMYETKEIMAVASTTNLFSISVASQNVPWTYFLSCKMRRHLHFSYQPYNAPFNTSSLKVGLSHPHVDEIQAYRNHQLSKIGELRKLVGLHIDIP